MASHQLSANAAQADAAPADAIAMDIGKSTFDPVVVEGEAFVIHPEEV